MSHIHRLAHIAGEGLHIEVPYNLGVDTKELVNVWVLLSGAEALSDDGLDLLDRPIRKWIGRNFAFRGGGPRAIPLDDLH